MVKVHGNWCGPNWTNGKIQTAREHLLSGGKFDGPCIDQLDCACRKHDEECSGEGGCTKAADTKLANQADRIVRNPLYKVFRPIMWAKARFIRDSIRLVRLTREQ